jgi:hypothetical protein
MTNNKLAIASCRVSSIEQLDSNSLNRQAESVYAAAKHLGVTIPPDGIWSGSVSSKAGLNYKRKDLREMLAYCKKNPAVKYLIVDEIDRFMRSMVEFKNKVGVKVWYAGDPELNSDNPTTKLLRALDAFKAEGSNLERQTKSIVGQTAALKDGRYTFHPKPGYMKGTEKGIHELRQPHASILKNTLLSIISKTVTPSEALADFNKSDFFIGGKAKYKMDKFRKIVTDPFYAGIVTMDKQVQMYNESGLHTPIITKDQHTELIRIMSNKLKNQSGPRKNGNPDYPLSNQVTCFRCNGASSIPRFVGFPHTNGKYLKVYEKYRCRSCGMYLHKIDMHDQVKILFEEHPATQRTINGLTEALDIVWREKADHQEQEIKRIEHKIKVTKDSISQQVEAATNPINTSIRDEILTLIEDKKQTLADLECVYDTVNVKESTDKTEFLEFAYSYVNRVGELYFDTRVSRENRVRCKQLIFPSGFYVDSNKKVYTPEISILYRLEPNKKDAEAPSKAIMVRVKRL